MIPADLEALVLADAVGALDQDERREFEPRIAALSADEQAQVARLYEVAVALGAGVEQIDPPARVRDRVLSAARAPQRYTLLSSEGDWLPSGLPGIETKISTLEGAEVLLVGAIADYLPS